MGAASSAPLVLLGVVGVSAFITRKQKSLLHTEMISVGNSATGTGQVGKPVFQLFLENGSMRVGILSRGCALTNVILPGNIDVVMGYENLEQYEKGKANFGTVVGRCANRVKQGKFTLDDKNYQLSINNGQHHLHGGTEGFFSRVFDVESCEVENGCAQAVLSYRSYDGEEGYPGSLLIRVIYSLNMQNQLRISFSASHLISDAPLATIVNLCNHAYWNLGGHSSGSVLTHELALNSQEYTPVDENMIITGEKKSVDGTAFDFRKSTPLGARLSETPGGNGYDLNYVLHGRSLTTNDRSDLAQQKERLPWAATLRFQNREMNIHTNAPGIQLYTGNFINSKDCVWAGKGAKWDRFGAVCLESQNWPDAVNNSTFPSPILRPGQFYRHEVVHSFSW